MIKFLYFFFVLFFKILMFNVFLWICLFLVRVAHLADEVGLLFLQRAKSCIFFIYVNWMWHLFYAFTLFSFHSLAHVLRHFISFSYMISLLLYGYNKGILIPPRRCPLSPSQLQNQLAQAWIPLLLLTRN